MQGTPKVIDHFVNTVQNAHNKLATPFIGRLIFAAVQRQLEKAALQVATAVNTGIITKADVYDRITQIAAKKARTLAKSALTDANVGKLAMAGMFSEYASRSN
jgi:hypothetical protein